MAQAVLVELGGLVPVATGKTLASEVGRNRAARAAEGVVVEPVDRRAVECNYALDGVDLIVQEPAEAVGGCPFAVGEFFTYSSMTSRA